MTILGKLSLLSYGFAFLFIVTVYNKAIGTPFEEAATWIGFAFIILGAFLALLQNEGFMDDKLSPDRMTEEDFRQLEQEIAERKAQLEREALEAKRLEAEKTEASAADYQR